MSMIRGYDKGTEVKWMKNKHQFMSGTIRERFFSSGEVTVDGKDFTIQASGDSPTYIVETMEGNLKVMDHTDVFAKDMNNHTGNYAQS